MKTTDKQYYLSNGEDKKCGKIHSSFTRINRKEERVDRYIGRILIILLLLLSSLVLLSMRACEKKAEPTIAITNSIDVTKDDKKVNDDRYLLLDYRRYSTAITDDEKESLAQVILKDIKGNKLRYQPSNQEMVEFLKVTEAEVTGSFTKDEGSKWTEDEGYEAKLGVAQVILSRIEDKRFPNNMHDVIYQQNAFSPVLDGRIETVNINSITAVACRNALLAKTDDITENALFFQATGDYNPYGTYLYTDVVGHSYFTYDED